MIIDFGTFMVNFDNILYMAMTQKNKEGNFYLTMINNNLDATIYLKFSDEKERAHMYEDIMSCLEGSNKYYSIDYTEYGLNHSDIDVIVKR